MIKICLIITIFSFASFSQINSCSKNEVSPNKDLIIEKNADEIIAEKFFTISELNKQKPDKGIFETKGFVAKVYTCPPCPPDAQCKPCMGNNIVISEENKSLDNYDLTEKEMIIFTVKAKEFTKGKKYNFKVKIINSNKTSANLNDAELISAELIKE